MLQIDKTLFLFHQYNTILQISYTYDNEQDRGQNKTSSGLKSTTKGSTVKYEVRYLMSNNEKISLSALSIIDMKSIQSISNLDESMLAIEKAKRKLQVFESRQLEQTNVVVKESGLFSNNK